MQKQDFETYQKYFRDFKILPKFSETHVFWGTIHHLYQGLLCALCLNLDITCQKKSIIGKLVDKSIVLDTCQQLLID